MKTFTLDEAQSLLPILESLLKRALDGRKATEAIEAELSELNRRIYLAGGMCIDTGDVVRKRKQMDEHRKQVRETVTEIDAIGVQVKDIETGLLDFPCRVDDEVVLLCWRMGEPAIEHWHPMDTGIRGRQPIDERFRRRSAGNRPN